MGVNINILGDCFNQVWEDTQTWEWHEERSLLLYARNRRHSPLLRATWESTRVSQEAEGVGGNCGQETFLWFLWEGMREAG